MYLCATNTRRSHAFKGAALCACLQLLLLLAILLLGTGGCAAPRTKQGGLASKVPGSEIDAEYCTGAFNSREECENAAVVYQEFLHKWFGEQQATQYFATEDAAFYLCAPGKGDEDERLLHRLCAQVWVNLQQEDVYQAQQYVLCALELKSDFPPAQLLSAEVEAAQGDTAEALVQFEQIFAAHPHLNRLHLRTSALHMEQQEYASAAEDLQRYLYEQPEAEAVLLQLGRIQAQQKHYADAIKTLQTLIDLSPDNPVAYFELGQVLEQQREFKRALDLYRTAAHTLEHSVQEFEYLQAKLLLEQHEFAAAADVLRSSLAREESVPLRLLYGFALLQLEQYAAAVPELRSAAEGLEFNSMAWLWLGKTLALQQQWYDAIAALQQVSEGDARSEALLHLAGLYHAVGYNQDAIAALDELLDRGVSDPILYQHLSYLHLMEQNNPSAVTALEHGVEKHPDSVELKYRLGQLYAMLGKNAAALKYMEQVVLERPDDATVLNDLAYLYAETEQNLEHALTMAQAALEQGARAEFHDTLGWVYFKLKRYAPALKHLRRAHDMRPHDAQILQHLGDLYTAMGQKTQAEKTYIKYLELRRDNMYLHDKPNPFSTERQAK